MLGVALCVLGGFDNHGLIVMTQSGDILGNGLVTQAAGADDMTGLGTGGILDDGIAHIVANIDGGGNQLIAGLHEGDIVLANGVSLEHAVDIVAQLAIVSVQFHLIDADSAILCAGLDILVNHEAVNLSFDQLLQFDFDADFVLGIAGDDDQIRPVGSVAGNALLFAIAHCQVVFLSDDISIQVLQTESGRDHACTFDAGMHGVPLTQDSGLFQFKDSPCAVAAGAPLGSSGTVKHAVCFLTGVFTDSQDAVNGQGSVIDIAKDGTLGGVNNAVAISVSDGNSDTVGTYGLSGQVSLIDPISLNQFSSVGAGSNGVGGLIPCGQQFQSLVACAVVDNIESLDGILLHSGLLVVVVEAHGSDVISVDGPEGPRLGISVVNDLDVTGKGTCINIDDIVRLAIGNVDQFIVIARIAGNLNGEITKVAVAAGSLGPHDEAVQQILLAQVNHIVNGGVVEVHFSAVDNGNGFAADFLLQVGILEVFLNAGNECAFIGGSRQVHLGTVQSPVVGIGVSSGVSSSQGSDLAVVHGEVVQLDVGRDVQSGHLGAGQVQVLQLGTAGQIQIIVAVVLQGQGGQCGQITQDNLGFGLAVEFDGNQLVALIQNNLLDACGQHTGVQFGEVIAAEVNFGQAGQGRQAGQISNAQVGQIQRTGEINQILQGGANHLTDGFQQCLIGEAVGAVLSAQVSNFAVHEHQGSGSGNIAVDIGQGDDNGGHAGGTDVDALQGVGTEAVKDSLAAVDIHGHGLPVALHRQGEVVSTDLVLLGMANIGFAEVIGQIAEVVDKTVVVGQSQDVILTVFNVDVKGDGAVAGLGSGGFLLGVPVAQLDFSLAAVPGNNQLVVGGSGLDIGDTGVIQRDLSACALRAVDTHGADFQSNHILAVFQSLDVVVLCVCAADETLGAVNVDSVDVIVVDGGVVSDVPGDLELVGGVEHLLQLHTGGSGGSVVVAVGNNQAAQVDLIVFNSLGCGQLNADGGDDLAGILAQIHGSGGPAGLLAGVLDGQDDGLRGIAVLEGDSDANLGSVISGGLMVGQSDLGVCSDIQLGLVEVDRMGVSQVAVDSDGITAVPGADLSVGERTLMAGMLGAVVPIHFQGQGFAGGFHPPLPGGQNGLDVQVGPLHITGDFAVDEVLHAVAGGEVGSEDSAVDDGLLNNVLGEALEVDGACADIVTVHAADRVSTCVLSGRGEVHTLTLFHIPLILSLVTVVVGTVKLVLIPVGAPDGEGSVGLAVLIYAVVTGLDIGAKLPLTAFDTHEDDLVGVQTQSLSVSLGVLQRGGAIPVVQEDGVGDAAVLGVPDPAVVVVVELILVGDGAGIANGVIPLDVCALLAHPLQHIPEQGDISGGDVFFLVDEVAVEAVVVHDVDELLGIGIVAVLILVQPLLRDLRNTGSEVLSQGQNTVLMSGIGCGSLGNGNGAVLERAEEELGLFVNLLGGTAAGTGHIGVLPELIQVVAEIVVCHACVPGTVAGVGVTVVGRGDGVQTGLVDQAGVCLGCCVSVDTVLQGNLSDQFFGIVVSCGIPMQDVNEPVAVGPGFVGFAGFRFGFFSFGLCCEIAGQQRQNHNQSQNERQRALQILHNFLPNNFRFSLGMLLPFLLSKGVDTACVCAYSIKYANTISLYIYYHNQKSIAIFFYLKFMFRAIFGVVASFRCGNMCILILIRKKV